MSESSNVALENKAEGDAKSGESPNLEAVPFTEPVDVANPDPMLLMHELVPALPSIAALAAAAFFAIVRPFEFTSYVVALCSVVTILLAGLSMYGKRGFDWSKKLVISAVITSALLLSLLATFLELITRPFSLAIACELLTCAAFFSGTALWIRFLSFFRAELRRSTTGTPADLVGAAWKREALDSREEKVDPETLKIGDLCVCRPGNVVPCDGVIVRGTIVLQERVYCGLKQLRTRGVGDKVSASSRVVSGTAVIRISSELQDSRATSFLTHISESEEQRSAGEAALGRATNSAAMAGVFLALSDAFVLREFHVSWFLTFNSASAILTLVGLVDFYALLNSLTIFAIRAGFARGALFRTPRALSHLAQSKEFIIDYSSSLPPFEPAVRDYMIFDERIDPAGLNSSLLAIFSRDGSAAAFSQRLKGSGRELTAYQVEGVQRFNGGMIAQVDSAEFSIGTEEFLIARGVKLQLSEIASDPLGRETIFVAIGDTVVARFVLAAPNLALLRKFLARFSMHARLWGTAAAEKIDAYGKESGLELAQVAGGLTVDQYLSKLQDVPHSAMLLSDGCPVSVIPKTFCSLSVFDPVRWDIERSDVVLFDDQEAVLEDAISNARSYALAKRALYSLAGVVIALLVIAAACALIPPGAVIAACTATIFAGWFLCDYFFIRSWAKL